MIYAIATLDTVSVYSTQSLKPIVELSDIHYASISDLAWYAAVVCFVSSVFRSKDGKSLGISSLDGFCSFAIFRDGELGTPLSAEGKLIEC